MADPLLSTSSLETFCFSNLQDAEMQSTDKNNQDKPQLLSEHKKSPLKAVVRYNKVSILWALLISAYFLWEPIRTLSSLDPSHFDIMNVSIDTANLDLRRQYRALSRLYHPDKTSDPDDAAKYESLLLAYRVLTNSTQRSSYLRFGDFNKEGLLTDEEHFLGIAFFAVARIIVQLVVFYIFQIGSRVTGEMHIILLLLQFSLEMLLRFSSESLEFLNGIPWFGSLPSFIKVQVINVVVAFCLNMLWVIRLFVPVEENRKRKIYEYLLRNNLESANVIDELLVDMVELKNCSRIKVPRLKAKLKTEVAAIEEQDVWEEVMEQANLSPPKGFDIGSLLDSERDFRNKDWVPLKCMEIATYLKNQGAENRVKKFFRSPLFYIIALLILANLNFFY